MAYAIDEFIYMMRNSLTYDELLKERGLANELYWKPNFVVETHHSNGNIYTQYYTDEQNQKHGSYKVFYKNGNLGYHSIYSHGQESNPIYYYGTGEKAIENNTYWYPNGQVLAVPIGHIFTIFDDQGTKLGYGTLEENRRFNVKDSSIRFGITEHQIKSLTCFKDYKQHGMAIEWYETGALRGKMFFVDGNLEGSYQMWYSNGHLHHQKYYSNGLQIDLATEWWVNGKISIQGYYDNGNKIGFWNKWYENGQLKEEIYYDVVEMGLAKTWHFNGVLAGEVLYLNGNQIGTGKTWHPNNVLKSCHNDIYYEWDTKKNLIIEGFYENDQKHGLWTEWYSTGHLKFQCCYEHDKKSFNY